MAENPLLALIQNMLSGSTSVEQTALINLICQRLLTSGLTVSNAGVIGTTVATSFTLASSSLTGTVAVANGGTNLASGTSGGILGFTATGTIASSVALTASALILGGGAGATPTPMASLGTTTTVLHGNAGGAPTFGAVVEADITLANNATNNVSIARHGLVPIAPNVATQFLDGTGVFSTPVSTGLQPVYTAKTATYTAVANDAVAATSGTFTVTLPAASSNANKGIWVVNNGTGTITVGRTGSDTVGLATSQTLNPATATTQGDSMMFLSDGVSNWNIL